MRSKTLFEVLGAMTPPNRVIMLKKWKNVSEKSGIFIAMKRKYNAKIIFASLYLILTIIFVILCIICANFTFTCK